ncbi:MAG: hypothetical protein Ct9H300mP15_19440 [Gemmatimonadota bacterium]|nr:MAG: hypothetical protein Ct9H300mP15_19440 [Gemmatimonadota bacterium]
MIIHADENSKRVAGETWHSDVSCSITPPWAQSFGFTRFRKQAETQCSQACMKPTMRFQIHETVPGKSDSAPDGGPYYRSVNTRIGRDDGGRTYPTAEHPVIRTHPVSGKKALYVNSMFTQHIIELPKAESDAVLEFLFAHVQDPAFPMPLQMEEELDCVLG